MGRAGEWRDIGLASAGEGTGGYEEGREEGRYMRGVGRGVRGDGERGEMGGYMGGLGAH